MSVKQLTLIWHLQQSSFFHRWWLVPFQTTSINKFTAPERTIVSSACDLSWQKTNKQLIPCQSSKELAGHNFIPASCVGGGQCWMHLFLERSPWTDIHKYQAELFVNAQGLENVACTHINYWNTDSRIWWNFRMLSRNDHFTPLFVIEIDSQTHLYKKQGLQFFRFYTEHY